MITFDLYSIVLLFGVFQGFFLTLVFWFHKKGNRQAHRLLAFLLAIASFALASNLLLALELYDKVPHLLGTFIPLAYLVGPAIFFYTKSFLEGKTGFGVRHAIHLLPFVAITVFNTPFYLLPATRKVALIRQLLASEVIRVSPLDIVLMVVQVSLVFAYLYFSLKLMRQREQQLKGNFSDSRVLSFDWLRKLLLVYAIFNGIHLVAFLLLGVFNSYTIQIDMSVSVVNSLMVHVIGYLALLRPAAVLGEHPETGREKYQKSTLSSRQAQVYARRLSALMASERLYLDSNLRLSDLAERLSISSNHLSQILNQELKVSFFDFVNEYRIKDARDRLLDPRNRHLTILGIALEVGFSNKTSFNRIFKKHTGVTPSQFVKSEQQVRVSPE